jgi:hypothetical protein
MSLEDMSGKRFGRWVVVRNIKTENTRHSIWECECDCGTRKIIRLDGVKSGRSSSCGCKRKEYIESIKIFNSRKELQKSSSKKASLKGVSLMLDRYVKGILRRNFEYHKITPEMIELKRDQITIHRLLKEARGLYESTKTGN